MIFFTYIKLLWFMTYFLVFALILILMVAYFTLFERKIISAVQRRNGPDFVGIFGLIQPIADALKLLFKEFIFSKNSFSFIFLLSPLIIIFLSLVMWAFLPLTPSGSFFNSDFSFLWVLCISSLDVYIIFLSGLSSSNKFAILGSLRSVIQMVSYEIAFSLLIAPVVFLSGSLSLYDFVTIQLFYGVSNYMYFIPNTIIAFICLLAETNRAPFDLPEAEAELVAGYNVEYSSLPFAFFFLGEYLNMISASTLMVLIFFSGWSSLSSSFFLISIIVMTIKILFFCFIIVWVRASLPRIRYDILMEFCWKFCLPFSSAFIFFFISFYSLLIYIHF